MKLSELKPGECFVFKGRTYGTRNAFVKQYTLAGEPETRLRYLRMGDRQDTLIDRTERDPEVVIIDDWRRASGVY